MIPPCHTTFDTCQHGLQQRMQAMAALEGGGFPKLGLVARDD